MLKKSERMVRKDEEQTRERERERGRERNIRNIKRKIV